MVDDPETQAENALMAEELRQAVKNPGFKPRCRACKLDFRTPAEATEHIKKVHSG